MVRRKTIRKRIQGKLRQIKQQLRMIGLARLDPSIPRWSPREIYPLALWIPRTSSIWEMRVDGTNLHPVFPGWNVPAVECCGSWTHDGKYYIFQSTRERTSNVWIVRDNPQWWQRGFPDPIQLTTGPLQFEHPVLSREGKELLVTGLQQRAELVRYDSHSGEFIPYLGGMSASDPDFSRDDQWITYVKFPDATLWRSKVDGSGALQLTYPP